MRRILAALALVPVLTACSVEEIKVAAGLAAPPVAVVDLEAVEDGLAQDIFVANQERLLGTDCDLLVADHRYAACEVQAATGEVQAVVAVLNEDGTYAQFFNPKGDPKTGKPVTFAEFEKKAAETAKNDK